MEGALGGLVENTMIRVLRYPGLKAEKFLGSLLSRMERYPLKLEKKVANIGREVKAKGDLALCEFTFKFDEVSLKPEEFRVSEEEIERSYQQIEPELLSAIKLAVTKVRSFHSKTLPKSWFDSSEDGCLLGQLIRAVDSAGLYIPGGKGGETPLISTVIMTAVPAKLAGVKKVIMCSPPRSDKSLHPALLVAGKEAGVDEIYRIGGPWSIFAMAYGTETIPKVDVICGPGNIYVTLAKKLVAFQVGIDLLAGPSEVLIVADNKADPDFVVWDLLAQAEHDPLSMSVLITTSEKLVKEVKVKIKEALSKKFRSEIVLQALRNRGAIFKVNTLEEAIELANRIAPEHLELIVENPESYLPLIKNAGAIFLGAYTPEAVGDYMAGPNHVLPTMGLARFTGGLSVEQFLKKINFMKYSPQALKRESQSIITLALNENLPSHAEAVRIRLKNIT
ncbi:MAG: histidinol dehydrogenase [Caldimicrobium sp.]|nr:histidinol dehydrogenase [Caldimicrobium sp.]MCX7874339.1 histidinol dehydrogenase [Caldimicrobium sp.]MDW8094980.1 histidinol dehydrogenase [Caldimicrobium sp.]